MGDNLVQKPLNKPLDFFIFEIKFRKYNIPTCNNILL